MKKELNTTEFALETHISEYLRDVHNYIERPHQAFDNKMCMDTELFIQFLESTQPQAVAKIRATHQDAWQTKILSYIDKDIRQKGILAVLERGITDGYTNTTLQCYYPKPSTSHNPDTIAQYKTNQISYIRQVRYSPTYGKSLDMVICINGLPIASIELKNPLTGQTYLHAIEQYKKDRDPKEELFRVGRMLVHFAVDTEQIYMCTHLSGSQSRFLPFNKGYNDGAGNPPTTDGIATAYLWKDILSKDTLDTIIQHFATLLPPEGSRTINSKTTTSPASMLFPRYHQLDAVRRMTAHARQHGAGQKYLIQHSAGSGKSNSIAWLTLQLASLHNPAGDKVIFDTIIVVTDRIVLDRQIQGVINRLNKVQGVVQNILHGSKQLRESLEAGHKVIVTTIQKFPQIVEDMQKTSNRTFAVIIDEAHSSLSGQLARSLNETLANDDTQADEEGYETPDHDILTMEDYITNLIKSRKLLPNVSYFAFTATPKNKTLELFGTPYQLDGQTKYKAFHIYSMRQAIEEGFIMDVLQNYTTYQSFYALLKKAEDDPQYDKKRAQSKLRQYVEGHEFAIQKKTSVIIEHFLQEVIRARKVGGNAKAMVVTSSRANAIRYKRELDKQLAALHQPYKTLVAFSGEVDGETEQSLNHIARAEIPSEFAKPDYRFLIVANKYQTGFDQPLLQTMYVDKKLGGVNAVQTLSRLNRSHKDKTDTFVLDFANETDDIKAAFEPYYTTTVLSEGTDPNKLFELQTSLDDYQLYSRAEVEAFANACLRGKSINELYGLLNAPAARFEECLTADEQADFRTKLKSFTRLYGFLSQILPYENVYFEYLYTFLTNLAHKLGSGNQADWARGILKDIDMETYRVEQQARISMVMEDATELAPMPATMRSANYNPDMSALSAIVEEFNQRYGTEFGETDHVGQLVETIGTHIINDPKIQQTIRNSDKQNARITSDKHTEDLMVKNIKNHFEIFNKFNKDKEFKTFMFEWVFAVIQRELNIQPNP